MTGLLRQYRREIRNIFLVAIAALVFPYLPALADKAMTTTGMIFTMSLAGAVVLAMTLKLYFRTLVMRITKENK
ncbi:hypothetical protein [Chitinophaga tropicalis]|uniref:Uncharacterized protein n=1 Tax=Chitinophaga tropicalis TaxID=2683588 RepID=A0A7K1TWZ3_9BACT|nr:hypothetical protein [Chitinophaga tropicalis]MVT06631.1 hypothetical protein [Chitinophaga tropicalis]